MGNLSLTTNQNLFQSGFSGYGSLLTVSRSLDNTFPGTFVGALMGISAVNIRTNVIPSYHMRSKGRFQSFSPGLRDGGEVSAAVNWLPGPNDTQGRYADDWSLLRQATLESNDLTRIRVFGPDPDLHVWVMDGFLTQLGPFSYQPEAIMSGQVGWKIVGEPRLITPIVWDVTANATWSSTAANGFSASGVLSDVSKSSAVSTGSSGTTIRVGGNDVNNLGGGNPFGAAFASGANQANATVSVQHTGLPSSAVATGDVGKIRWRSYVPGLYELWGTPAASALYNAAVGLGGSSSERSGFAQAVVTNSNRFYVAVYGDDEVI